MHFLWKSYLMVLFPKLILSLLLLTCYSCEVKLCLNYPYNFFYYLGNYLLYLFVNQCLNSWKMTWIWDFLNIIASFSVFAIYRFQYLLYWKVWWSNHFIHNIFHWNLHKLLDFCFNQIFFILQHICYNPLLH